MAKRYNITFNNESEYLSFKASSAYYEPNVSLTLDDNGAVTLVEYKQLHNIF